MKKNERLRHPMMTGLGNFEIAEWLCKVKKEAPDFLPESFQCSRNGSSRFEVGAFQNSPLEPETAAA